MPKRRTTILGIGALATGSGAAFTSAAFGTDSTAPTASMEVLTDGNIVVEGTTTDESVEELDGNSLFDDGGIAGDIDRDDLPAARVNGESNSELEIEVLLELREDGEFSPLLEVTNGDAEDVDIRIDYEDAGETSLYGDEVDDEGNDLQPGDVQNIYQFKDEGGTRISPAPDYTENPDNTGENTVTISPGQTEEISLDLDTTFNSGDQDGDADGGSITGILNSIAGSGSRGFGSESTGKSVELLSGILVHAESESE